MERPKKQLPHNFLTALSDEPCFETLIALKPGPSTIAQLRGRLRSAIDAHAVGVRLTALERVGLVARCRSGVSDTWFLKRGGLSAAISRLSELLDGGSCESEDYEFSARFAKIFNAYKIYPTPTRLRILEILVKSSGTVAQILEKLPTKTTRRTVNHALWAFERAGIAFSMNVGPQPGPGAVISLVFSATPLAIEMVRAIHSDSWPCSASR